MKNTIAALAAVATLGIASAASATSITISSFNLGDFTGSVGAGTVETFESYAGGTLSGALTGTAVGTFSSIGGTGSGSTCNTNGGGAGCSANLAIQDDQINGQGNLVPFGGTKSLNSNDTLGIIWDAALTGGGYFTRLVFGIRDAAEFKTLTVTAGGETKTLQNQSNGNAKLFVIDFDTAMTAATIRMEHSGLNDGFTIDGAAAIAPVPLPASAWLMLAGLGGIAAVRRKKA